MQGAKVNKGPQGNNRRFVNRNRRDDTSFNHSIHQDNNLSSQGGKINSVQPRYSSVDHAKHLEMRPGMVVLKQDDVNKNDSKSNFKGKDGPFHGGKDGQFHGQHPQKEHRSNVKYEDRRKYNYPKERANTRNFKPRNQNRGNEVPANDDTRLRKPPNKNESLILKRNENTSMPSTPQHLKPAVHVQPLQQVPEKNSTRSTVEQNPNNLQTSDSSVRRSSQGGAEGCQELSNVGHGKETNTQRSTQHHKPSEHASSTMIQTGGVEAPTQDRNESKQALQKTVLLDQNPLNQMNPIFQTEARSLADLNTSGLGSYLSSSICSSFVPQEDLLKPQSDPSTNQNMLQDGCLSSAQLALAQSQPNHHSEKFLTDSNLVPLTDRSQDSRPRAGHDNVKEPLVDHAQNSFQVPRDHLEETVSLQGMPDEKYGYRISVDSLFSTSFFTNPQAGVKNKKEMVETRDPPHDSHVVKNQTSQETTVLPSQTPHGQLLNQAQQFDVVNSNKMMTNNTSLENHMVKNQDALTHCNQVPQDQLLNETQQFDVVSPNKIKTTNPSLLAYQSLSQDNYNDPHLVSPRRSKDVSKPTLGSPPPVLRNLAPHASLESATALMKDAPFSLGSVNTRTYRSFSDQTEEINKEKPLTGKMSAFSREDSSKTDTRSLKPDMASEKEIVNNVAQLNHAQMLQEPVSKLSLTKANSDVQTDSLVNLNYREIPKQSMNLQPDCSAANETKEPVSAPCPTTTDKTSLLTKVELQPATSDKEGYEKQNDPPSLSGDIDGNRVHRGPFPQGPFLPNPFLSHSLLTHRQAIPSAFVYPSRVGIPGSHSGFTDVAQHTGTNPGSHIFQPHGTTVCLNVGGRIFEILPSTFSPYPESLLSQIFTGAAPAPISQRGHIFYDRDGYLFEIILAFARVGHLTIPPSVNLTTLMNEAKFFGMYEYMFQKGQVSSGNMLQFQRTTRCTLHCDDSSKTSDTRVFVLQGDDKLKIESLRVSGPCYLYVDLYTPLGVKETSNFVICTPDKPDLWKAYQFCAERQLVFHLEQAHSDTPVKSCNKSSVEIVFAQTFIFAGDEFVS